MSEIAKGRGVRVEIGYTESAEKTVTAVSKDSPAQVTSTAHGLAFGSVGYFKVGKPRAEIACVTAAVSSRLDDQNGPTRAEL